MIHALIMHELIVIYCIIIILIHALIIYEHYIIS